jgi:hypothetical protein
VENASVVADVEALLLQVLDKCEYELLVFMRIADERVGDRRSPRDGGPLV